MYVVQFVQKHAKKYDMSRTHHAPISHLTCYYFYTYTAFPVTFCPTFFFMCTGFFRPRAANPLVGIVFKTLSLGELIVIAFFSSLYMFF